MQGGNDLYWRLEAPAKAVGGKEVIVPEDGGLYAICYPNNDSAFPWSLRFQTPSGVATAASVEEFQELCKKGLSVTESASVYPEHEGTAVWIRPDLARATHAKAMRKQGIRTVAEVDDNYLCDPRQNIFLRENRMSWQGQWDHLRATASMDTVVFSTAKLRDMYAKAMRKHLGKQGLPELAVCRNNIDLADWPERVESDGPVRVGWMGSPSHVWDVDLAWPALLHARNMGCETWMIGYSPVDFDINTEAPGAARSEAKKAQWRKVDYKHVPWRMPGKYERLSLPLDIGLCPLLSNEFTLGKSDVKAIEYGVSGAAVVAQNNEVYNRTLVHGETALLAGSPQEMLNHVDLLIRDANLRERLVTNLQQYIREERGLDQLREEWGAVV